MSLDNLLESLLVDEAYPEGSHQRKVAVKSFARKVKNGEIVVEKCGVRAGRRFSLAFWRHYRQLFPALTDQQVRAAQRRVAAIRKKAKRKADRRNGVTMRGTLLREDTWRMLRMGDHVEKVWRAKLSFVPVVKLGRFGSENLCKLQDINARLVKAIRLRGGATKTKTHSTGKSVGRTVSPGGRPSRVCARKLGRQVSGTIQMAAKVDANLQKEVVQVVTACIEEAFGSQHWYKATKECFRHIPSDRRLPDSPLPGSAIWWSWKDIGSDAAIGSEAHIDSNALPPCFVFCPYTYDGAELLCSSGNRKIPMPAGRILAGAWQRFPHCNARLFGEEDRYSFVVYMDYRMLNESYVVRD